MKHHESDYHRSGQFFTKPLRPRSKCVFQILVYDVAESGKWPVNTDEMGELYERIQRVYRSCITKCGGIIRSDKGDGGHAFFPAGDRSDAIRAAAMMLVQQRNIEILCQEVSPEIRIRFRLLLSRAEVRIGETPGQDASAHLSEILKFERDFTKEGRLRALDRAYTEFTAAERKHFTTIRGPIRKHEVYELRSLSVQLLGDNRRVRYQKGKRKLSELDRLRNRCRGLAHDISYYRDLAAMTGMNIAARNLITSRLLRRLERTRNGGRHRSEALTALGSFNLTTDILDATYEFFTKVFRDVQIRVTFWRSADLKSISVIACKYPTGQRCRTYERKLCIPIRECAAGFSMLHQKTIFIPDIRQTRVPYGTFYPGQIGRRIRSIACFPIGIPALGVLCVASDRPGLFEDPGQHFLELQVSSFLLNLELACHLAEYGL